MFDVASERFLALRMHPPTAIYGMLALFLIPCARMAGIGMAPGRERNGVHRLGFAGIMSAALSSDFHHTPWRGWLGGQPQTCCPPPDG